MSDLSRFGVSIELNLLENFDRLVAQRGYATRSEALRDLIRAALVREHVETHDEAEVLGSLTLVYDHHARELTDRMTEMQHDCHELVVSVMHIHVNHHDCMEVIVLRGAMRAIRELADSLLSLKGVKHGELFTTLSSREMTEGISKTRRRTHTRGRGTTHA